MTALASLPDTIARLVDAVRRGDVDEFLSLFTDDGVVDDWGRRFEGLSAIRAWSDEEFIGAHGRLAVSHASCRQNEVTLDADWRSDFYSGASRFVFALEGERIRAMTIPVR